jgi:hypothetical protein
MNYLKGPNSNRRGRPLKTPEEREATRRLWEANSQLLMKDACAEMKYNSAIEMINFARSAKSENIRFQACLAILSRSVPLLKSMEITGSVQSPFNIILNMAKGENERAIE